MLLVGLLASLGWPELGWAQDIPRRLSRRSAGYRVSGSLNTSFHAYRNDLGSSHGSAYSFAEGASGALTGHLWKPRFARFKLSMDAATYQAFSSLGFFPGRRVGLDADLSILPKSIVPLDLHVGNHQSIYTNRSLPGTDYRSRSLGLTWRFLAPQLFPRVWLSLTDNRFLLHSDSLILPDQTGLQRGQDFAGRLRQGSLVLIHEDLHSHIQGRYRIRERQDSRVNELTGELDHRRLITEGVHLGGQATPTPNLALSLNGNLRASRSESFESRRFHATAKFRYVPAERFSTSAAYTFQGDSLFGTTSHSALAQGRYQWTDSVQLRSSLNLGHQSYAEGASIESSTQESIGLGATWRDSFGRYRASASDNLRLGVAQVNPGEAGLLFSNALEGSLWAPLARDQQLSLDGGVSHSLNRSTFGNDSSSYRLGSRWTGLFGEKLRAYGVARFAHNRRNERFQGFGPDHRTQLQTWGGVSYRFARNFGGSGRLGWVTGYSSATDRFSSSANASLGLSWTPVRSLSLRGRLASRTTLFGGRGRGGTNLELSAIWKVRALEMNAAYRLEATNRTGEPNRVQTFLVTMRRRFGAGI